MDHVIHGSFLKEKKHAIPSRSGPWPIPAKHIQPLESDTKCLPRDEEFDQVTRLTSSYEPGRKYLEPPTFSHPKMFFHSYVPLKFLPEKKTRVSYPKPSPPSPNQKPANANPAPQKKTRPRNLAPSSQRFTPCWRRVSSKCSNQFSLGPFFHPFFLNELLEIVPPKKLAQPN